MTAKTYRRAPVRVRVSKKSQVSRVSAWLRMKSAQVVYWRWGEGSIPCSLSISQTVEAATLMPRAASSPWMRRYPQALFSRARRKTRVRMERTVRGRLRRRGAHVAA